MKSISAGIKVGILVLLFVGGGYAVWKSFDTSASGEDGVELSALFRDASGLPVGSQVMVAGLAIGEISDQSIEGRYARVSFKVRRDVEIWDNAVIFKKSSSLLGAYYLEIDPGTPESVSPAGVLSSNTRLIDGDRIDKVIEATTVDQVLRRLDQSMPNVDKVLLSVRDLSEDLRRVVNGPLAATASRIDDLVQRESLTIASILQRADSSMARIEDITGNIRDLTGGADRRIERILAELEAASAEARTLVSTAREEVSSTGEKVREKLDLVDDILVASSSVAKKIDEDEGTLGRLVNDSTLADNLEDITDDARGFVRVLTGIQTYLGLRSEYNIISGLMRHYVTVELATRPDKYYYIEFEQGPRGNYPVVTLEFDPTINDSQYIRRVRIEDKFRFTFQIAKRLGKFTFRYGIKESTGGVGVDFNTPLFGRGLRMQMDVYDASFDQWPRVKIAAAYEVFRSVYVLAGVDEVLNQTERLNIDTGNVIDEPTQFDQFVYGRDYFFGAMLRINDEDLAALLAIGGSALSGT